MVGMGWRGNVGVCGGGGNVGVCGVGGKERGKRQRWEKSDMMRVIVMAGRGEELARLSFRTP